MKKEDIINHLRVAKAAHVNWVQKAKLLMNGVDVKEDMIPIKSTECNFGKWFYKEGQTLHALSNNPLEYMQKIEFLHFKIHDIYLNIFNICFPEKNKRGFFAKLFKIKRKKLSQAESELADNHYIKLEAVSIKFLEEISRLERRLLAVSDERIEALV